MRSGTRRFHVREVPSAAAALPRGQQLPGGPAPHSSGLGGAGGGGTANPGGILCGSSPEALASLLTPSGQPGRPTRPLLHTRAQRRRLLSLVLP